MLAMPLSGWLVNSAADLEFPIFGRYPLPAIVTADEGMDEEELEGPTGREYRQLIYLPGSLRPGDRPSGAGGGTAGPIDQTAETLP